MNLSVVVPVYNAEKYLAECVDSLVNQIQKPYEVLLIDDGSTDSSLKLCLEYEKRFDFIRVYHKNNQGLGLTRNYGMDRATGDYILFIDADDYFDNDFILEMTNKLKVTYYDAIKTCYKKVDDNRSITYVNRIENETVYRNDEIKSIFLPQMIGSSPETHDTIPMSSCATVYSLKILRKNNIRFYSEREWISEDILFNIDYYSKCACVLATDYIGYNYRYNNNSLTTSYLKNRFVMSRCLVQKEAQILQELGIYDTCKFRLSKQFFIYTRMSIEQLKKVSDKNKIINEIKSICNDSYLKLCISEYPISKLELKQRLFLLLLKHEQVHLLYYILAK